MIVKYRVKGKVERAFIMRGMYFPVASDIDFMVSDGELAFVKERCKVDEVADIMDEQDKALNSTLEQEIKSKEVVDNGTKRRNSKGKRPNNKQVQLS